MGAESKIQVLYGGTPGERGGCCKKGSVARSAPPTLVLSGRWGWKEGTWGGEESGGEGRGGVVLGTGRRGAGLGCGGRRLCRAEGRGAPTLQAVWGRRGGEVGSRRAGRACKVGDSSYEHLWSAHHVPGRGDGEGVGEVCGGEGGRCVKGRVAFGENVQGLIAGD